MFISPTVQRAADGGSRHPVSLARNMSIGHLKGVECARPDVQLDTNTGSCEPPGI